jgi:hypothetical protein
MENRSGTLTTLQGEIIDYPINGDGKLVTRRAAITKMKPRLDAPPPDQPGSVDFNANLVFGSRDKAFQMIESLVAGQGDNADEKWVQFILVYKQWQLEGLHPTLNEVCHSLNFDSGKFWGELQVGVQSLMGKVAHLKAAMAVPEVMDRVVEKAKGEEADVKERELALRIAGVIDERGGVNVQINNTNQMAVMTKGEKDMLKTPLRQFSSTLTEIDEEVRNSE